MGTKTVVRGTMHARFREILTPEALDFIAALDGALAGRRAELLHGRRTKARAINQGETLQFRADTAAIRADNSWQVAPIAPGLDDRRVELITPVNSRMTNRAQHSKASTWLADLEDSTSPTWENVITAQILLRDAVRGRLGRTLADSPTLILRPRGLHLCEKHLVIDGRPVAASFVDFGLFFFHNAQALIAAGFGPYFYIPKIENSEEARLWNDMFVLAQDLLGIPQGTVRATVLIETLPSAFEMEEILYELREHCSGLNAGRWDYIFSYVRTFAQRGEGFIMPDRNRVTMRTPLMREYTQLLVATAHKRGAHAIAAPAANDPSVHEEGARHRALNIVQSEMESEAEQGFDGCWVAHPDLIEPAMNGYIAVMDERLSQLDVIPEHRHNAEALVSLTGTVKQMTLEGLRSNLRVSLRYLAEWVRGQGGVAIDGLIEDSATVEIARAQIWQWLNNKVQLAEGPIVTHRLVNRLIDEEQAKLTRNASAEVLSAYADAREVLERVALQDHLPGFFTTYGYVRFLLDPALRMPASVQTADMRASEKV